jgi:hypothetical protein
MRHGSVLLVDDEEKILKTLACSRPGSSTCW